MPRGEIARLTWADLDSEKRLALVRDRKDPRPKSGNDQLPLLDQAWEILQDQPKVEPTDTVFQIGEYTICAYFTEACRELAVPDLHFHDLRHEGTSRLFEDGFDIQQVALATGYKDWRHLRRYTNPRREDLYQVAAGKRSSS